jgi:mono/diheme cytochrome c family protein
MPGDRPSRWRHAAAILLVLAAGIAAPVGPAGAQESAETPPVWAFDPAEPGPDRPPVGRSLFDRLFAAERDGAAVTDVPYPFAALRQRLLRHLGPGAKQNQVLAQVLIPHGRALQRNAAAPDYFASPRLVLAVVGDPLSPPPGLRGLGARLKDRLYIGYQEKARSLEVISYNETAGRFEFQIVEDYAPGRTPRVVYARRAVCIACHQNGGPIFSQPPWSETNANAEVARRLAARAPEFHGVAAEDGSRPFDQALLISTAVVKANLTSAYQRVWRDGCGQVGEAEVGETEVGENTAAIRCRAALLTAALQFKLSGGRHSDRNSEAYRDDLAAPLRRAWRRTWRSGLAIPKPLIPNRDPLAGGFDVTAVFDPLRARPSLDVWTGEDPSDLQAVVAGLAQLLPASDAARLDKRLRDLARDAALPPTLRRAPCAVSHRSLEGWGERFLFRCESEGPDGLLLNGHFYVRPQLRLEGSIPWLAMSEVGSEDARFEDLAVSAEHMEDRDGRTSVSFQPLGRRDRLHARLPDGSVIETIALTWAAAIEDDADPSAEIPDHPANGEVELTVVQDFAPVSAAVAGLLRQAEQGAPGVLSGSVFHGGRAMAAVLAAVGVGSGADCCGETMRMPPIALDAAAPDPGGASGVPASTAPARQAFATYCTACHATAGPFPPNFLSAGTSSGGDAIAHCAERIAFRLAMWDRPAAARTKSPMPPESWLRGAGWNPAAWRDGAPRAALREHLAGLLARAGISTRQVEQRGRRAYETLQPCLADAD